MELRQLPTFVTITQTESFSRAAEILGYSRPAVTVQIRLLGEEKGRSDRLWLNLCAKLYTHLPRML